MLARVNHAEYPHRIAADAVNQNVVRMRQSLARSGHSTPRIKVRIFGKALGARAKALPESGRRIPIEIGNEIDDPLEVFCRLVGPVELQHSCWRFLSSSKRSIRAITSSCGMGGLSLASEASTFFRNHSL